jgi:hypothetical protein
MSVFRERDGRLEIKRGDQWTWTFNFTVSIERIVCDGPDGGGLILKLTHSDKEANM